MTTADQLCNAARADQRRAEATEAIAGALMRVSDSQLLIRATIAQDYDARDPACLRMIAFRLERAAELLRQESAAMTNTDTTNQKRK